MTKQKRGRIMHCKMCGKASPSDKKTFDDQMAWLRRHRKRAHPKAHKKSVKKTLKTKKEKGLINKKGNPCPSKKRGKK